jgi:hypothetical protein
MAATCGRAHFNSRALRQLVHPQFPSFPPIPTKRATTRRQTPTTTCPPMRPPTRASIAGAIFYWPRSETATATCHTYFVAPAAIWKISRQSAAPRPRSRRANQCHRSRRPRRSPVRLVQLEFWNPKSKRKTHLAHQRQIDHPVHQNRAPKRQKDHPAHQHQKDHAVHQD